MGLFTKTKKSAGGGSSSGGKNTEAKQMAVATPASTSPSMGRDISTILKHARITEKASMHQAGGVYTFDIARAATKRDVIQAVRALYAVTPRTVRIVTVPTKVRRNARTGKLGMTGGGKKAYVYLKKGETITF
ncbi:50S ribosomal protein L23 [Candidatus Kaiserbacteria bacterium]|nr:50S ribosomal protein L23 [Candidatus Kaiserbacteria bacterium]